MLVKHLAPVTEEMLYKCHLLFLLKRGQFFSQLNTVILISWTQRRLFQKCISLSLLSIDKRVQELNSILVVSRAEFWSH